jgi:hypothetical protein
LSGITDGLNAAFSRAFGARAKIRGEPAGKDALFTEFIELYERMMAARSPPRRRKPKPP